MGMIKEAVMDAAREWAEMEREYWMALAWDLPGAAIGGDPRPGTAECFQELIMEDLEYARSRVEWFAEHDPWKERGKTLLGRYPFAQ